MPSLSLEELTSQSELIVSGQINRSWADWDSEHKYIWTHYELGVANTLKGTPGGTVVISEPGGVVGSQGMAVVGAPTYAAGEQVLVFLARMPNGYLRTTGWGQGKFSVDRNGAVRASGLSIGLEAVNATGRAATQIQAINGMNLAQVRAFLASRAQAQIKGGKQ